MPVDKDKRNYQEEYARESPERRKHRAKRNKARREMEREHGKEALKGKVIDHKKPLSKGGGTGRSNLRVQSAKASHSQGSKLQSKAAKAKGGKN